MAATRRTLADMRSALPLLVLTTFAHALPAQCPDGSPPPCRAVTLAAARRVNPPLDERTWIVLPFDNIARSADIDWLRDASVNLQYMDMSRWHDIRVVDDERVADLLRDVPEARDAKQLSLNTGLTVARRAGAGRLVMGDLLKVGSRTQVVAKVFDVRGGERIRFVREETPHTDSLLTIFGRIAKGILNVAPPPGEKLGAIGTTHVDAYQEYLAGVKALNRFDLVVALQQVRRVLDSALSQVPFVATMGSGFGGFALLFPRAMLQRAELAAALGFRDEARVWYKRFLDLWAKPDPEFQPAIARVRAAYQALGPG